MENWVQRYDTEMGEKQVCVHNYRYHCNIALNKDTRYHYYGILSVMAY